MLKFSLTLAGSMLCQLSLVAIATAQTIEVENHQPFPIQMPLAVRGVKVDSLSTVAQQAGDDAVVLIDVPANGKQEIAPRTGASASTAEPAITATDDGVAIKFGDKDLGKLAWGIVFEKLDKDQAKSDDKTAANHRNFDKLFKAIRLTFKQTASGPLFQTWSADGSSDGLHLAIALDVYHAGVIDIHTSLTNESAPQRDVYTAVAIRWQQPTGGTRSMDYNNSITPFSGDAFSLFRGGEGRHLFIQRGVDWINTKFDGASIAWLNDFTASFTVHKEASSHSPAHWTGANTAQLGQEAQSAGDTLYSITEIARPNIKMYAPRLQDNVLPAPVEPALTSTSRLFFSDKPFDDSRVDQMFVGYVGFNPQTKTEAGAKIEFGTQYVRFGTAYLPYSTLGENFQTQHLPGMSGESYWPLAADVVTNYKLFEDDIKRDLCIAKAMGFQTIRLHHLELIQTLPKNVQDEYLEFLFGQIKHLGLTALIDVKLPTPRVVEIVQKYLPLLEGLEIDNEVLIFGINDNEVDGWKQQYAAVKAVAPNLPIWLTAQTNTGAFDRIRRLGVPFDRTGEHCYMDSVDAIPTSRDYALAVANYAAKIGKEPIITEWNWRFLTRMTPEARAKIYPPIFENIFAAHCMPEIYQFQFQDSLAMAPKTLRGIRHYELLNLSRRPRPEALEFMQLIDKYADPALPSHVLQTSLAEADAPADSVTMTVKNNSDKPVKATVSAEAFQGLELSIDGDKSIEIPPQQQITVTLKPSLPPTAPAGFYQGFVRLEMADGQSSYGWLQYRRSGVPPMNKDATTGGAVTYLNDAINYDFNRPLTIVYGGDEPGPPADPKSQNAPGWQMESAWYIWETIESATGRPAKIYQIGDLPEDVRKSGNLILVGTPKSNALIAAINPTGEGKSYVTHSPANDTHGDTLLVVGEDASTVSDAAMDLVLRYWKFAKDSSSRRLSLTDKPIVKSPDPTALP